MDEIKIKNTLNTSIFQLMDKYMEDESIENKQLIRDNLLKNPLNFLTISDGMSLYSYATMLSLECLNIIHDIYTQVKSNLKKYTLPYEISNEEGSKPIHLAVEYNLKKQLEFLITTVKVDINTIDKKRNTPLHLACFYQRNDMCKFILYSTNVNVNAYNEIYETPLSICIDKNNTEIASSLLKRGANIIIPIGYKLTFNLYSQVKRSGNEQMNKLFKQYMLSENNKSKIKQLKQYYSKKQKIYTKEYNFLCNSLESDENLELIKYFANKLKINHEELPPQSNLDTKRELCKKISEKIILYNIKHRLM